MAEPPHLLGIECQIRIRRHRERVRARGYDHAMPHIELIEPEDATGPLKEHYDAAIGRAGKLFNIVKSMSLRPEVLGASMEMYKAIMFGPSELTRAERELLATVTSRQNDCHY